LEQDSGVTVDDRKLMLAYCEGDERAFEELYLRHRRQVHFFIRRFIPRDDLAEEVYQEAFVRLHKARHRYRPTAKFTTFLYTIVHRLCIDRSRSMGWRDIETRPRPENPMPEPASSAPGPEKEARRGEKRRILLTNLDRLAERRRAAVLLHDMYGYTAAEVGEALDCTTAAAKMTIFRGRRQLREMLEAEQAREEKTG
jgi:RNA polymerase sigma-70 factor, ECF subfamily